MPNSGQERAGNPGGNNGRNYLSPDGAGCLDKSPSLQRIHQQSSTETSGLGASEFSSRESIHSNQSFNDHKCDHGHLGKYRHAMVVPKDKKSLVSKSSPERKKDLSPESEMRTRFTESPNFDELFNQTSSNRSPETRTRYNNNNNYNQRQSDRSRTNQTQSRKQVHEHQKNDEINENIKAGENGRKHRSSRVPKLELQLEDEYNEWRRARSGSKGSIKSHNSRGSFRSRSGSNKFLGDSTDSAWMRWGRARRASFQKKLEVPEEVPQERATTPIKKARQELTAQFVHPDLTDKYISEDDINYIRRHRQKQYQTYHAIENSKKNVRLLSAHTDIYLSTREWKILSSFWKHKVFRSSRYLSLFFVILSIIVLCVSVSSEKWIIYHTSSDVDMYDGLWYNCVENRTVAFSHYFECLKSTRDFNAGLWDSCYQPFNATVRMCPEMRPHWQNAVIGLMIFSAGTGFLAAILAVLGVCTSPLPKKIYYFHSAGEIFLVCAMATGAALVIYPAGIERDGTIPSHYYGSGYGLGWGSAFFFLCAALCMSLDDLVRESAKAKCCRLCFKRGQAEGESQHV